MPGSPKTIPAQAGSELNEILDAAIETDILLEREGIQFRLSRVESRTETTRNASRQRRLAPQRALNIIGLGASTGSSDVANHKDLYIADAAADRGE